MIYITLSLLLFSLMLVYFKIAERFKIIDKPNNRSSHTSVTIRGGGIIFLVAIIIAGGMYPDYWIPTLGATIIGIISFADDRLTLSSRIRIVFHLLAVSTLFHYLGIFGALPILGIVALYILVIGIINAYNFMDGINGITGLYSLTILGGLQFINLYHVPFVEADMIWLPMISCLVFLFFNFRKRAKCFAGDVGSITIAFWILLMLLSLIVETGRWEFILFLSVYGVDSVLTIIHRIILKQNIFAAHRMHYYQVMANERKISHLLVSTIYAVIQLIIICLIISADLNLVNSFLISTLPLVALYMSKPLLMKAEK